MILVGFVVDDCWDDLSLQKGFGAEEFQFG